MVKNSKIKTAVPGYFFMLQILIFSLIKRVSIVMPIYKIMLFSFISILSLLSVTCKNEVTAVEDNAVPGRRDYVWTVDTLYLPFNPFTDITGTSPTDVWVCSPGDADKIFYHFNGQSWKTDLVFRVFSPKSVSSFSTSSVWSGGREGRIWHFNNDIWSENYKHSFNGITDITFETIYAITPTNILAAGQYFIKQDYWGIILHNDGNSWSQINIPLIRTAFVNIKKSDNDKFYLWGVKNEQFTESRYQFYEFDGKNLREIYSGSQSTNAEYGGLLQLGSKTYFIIGYDFYSYNGKSFIKTGRLSDDRKFMNAGVGRNEKDIFIGMRDGIAHYNGENTIYLYQSSENVFVREGVVFEKEIFFRGRDVNGNNLIFHGKLNE
ncbi:MAG: hypothetical protein CO127_06730 [Ignavibacteria bacterium CG_4_9_14_3_um_filter_36_18]|nr:MAG: hypothetical protein CO127_06730 [Ignavibacteria bacterium CG_4_9_14_3_um_filter_36_18]